METVTLSDSLQAGPLALLVQGILTDTAARNGNRLPGLASRIGFVATDTQEEVTLLFADNRCVIEPGLVSADLVFCAESDLLPRLQTVPRWLGVPVFLSLPGLELALSLLRHPLRVRGLSLCFSDPQKAGRALLDVARLIRLLAGAY